MTQDLFRLDAYLRECPATVLSAGEQGIVLDQTAFYPLGEGQAGDSGWLVLPDYQPRGGTHVANTAETGAVVVTKIKKRALRRAVWCWASHPPAPDVFIPSRLPA